MIHYNLDIARYKNSEKTEVYYEIETFEDINPINARQKAMNRYSSILNEIEESGEKVENLITGEDFGLGIRVYLVITDPFEKLWDKVVMPYEPMSGLGSNLEVFINELIENGEIESEDDFIYGDNDFQMILIGKGAVFGSFIEGLDNETKIYDFFGYDKNGLETIISCYDFNTKKVNEHRILKIDFNWEHYNQQCIIDNYAPKIERNKKESRKTNQRKNIEYKSSLKHNVKSKDEIFEIAVKTTSESIPYEIQTALDEIIKKWQNSIIMSNSVQLHNETKEERNQELIHVQPMGNVRTELEKVLNETNIIFSKSKGVQNMYLVVCQKIKYKIPEDDIIDNICTTRGKLTPGGPYGKYIYNQTIMSNCIRKNNGEYYFEGINSYEDFIFLLANPRIFLESLKKNINKNYITQEQYNLFQDLIQP